tara:strand:+ start:4043 stop:6760 length:2718 start_codon:yes stop_codon:yes gene_type:complete
MAKQHKYKIANIELSKLVSLLGKILGTVVKEQEGQLLYDKIEQIRNLSKSSRGSIDKKKIKLNDTKKFRELINRINKLNPSQSLIIARSFSKFLNFSNLAESLDNVHKVEEGEVLQARGNDEFTLLEDVVEKLLKTKKISKEKFYQSSKNLNIELVLTAHPTEVKRRTLIQKYTKVNDILEKFNKSRIFKIKNIEKEEVELERKLHEQITSIWKTDELKRSKPTPSQEAKWGLAVIEDSLWNSIPRICSRLNNTVFKYSGKRLPVNYSPFKFGSWMGGDRDGNPNVNHNITNEVILLSRWEAASLYEKELTNIIQDLSLHECTNEIKKMAGNSQEPYRVFLRPIRKKFKVTQVEIEKNLIEGKPINKKLLVNSIDEILKPLNSVYNSLCTVKCDAIANGSTLDLIRRANSFGLNLAKLDIRQEASKHSSLIQKIYKKLYNKNYFELTENEKVFFLKKSIQSKKSIFKKKITFNKEDKEVWRTFKLLSEVPRECLGAYIISMASKASDVLSVMLLQKEAGIKEYLRIVPLFETLQDLNNSNSVMMQIYENKFYLKTFKKKQEVMIGYSDSSKDAGKLAAAWAQYRSQETLQELSNKFKVDLTLFHGRGGSVGRGGGPIYHALLSQPPGTVNSRTRVTEQGEIIQQKYATESLSEYTLGTYLGSVIEATLAPPIRPKLEWRNLMDQMSEVSKNTYRNYLTNKDFLNYYFKVTPQKILEFLFIGSRPAKRNKSKNIRSLRAIPWVFAWTQIRFLIPAWLGTFDAINDVVKKNKVKTIKDMISKWPFFYSQMDMLDWVLLKTNQRIVKFYEECLGNEALKKTGEDLRNQLTKLIILNKKLIPKNIVEQRKDYKDRVRIRNTYAEVLNILQADILRKINKKSINKKDKMILRDALLITIAGIAASMKNVG